MLDYCKDLELCSGRRRIQLVPADTSNLGHGICRQTQKSHRNIQVRCLRVRPPRTLNPETRTKNNSTPAPCSDRTNPVHNAHMLLSFHFEAACAQWATADLFGK
ncbi:uncharacterized protein LOC6584179 [Drosophila mojavensis]|uniref:uncharacterized protein LOC6584179 n=1 Tax=Drosophila mojavensis TaxID=7230 RepID=UPI0013EE9E1A|nr:uncharacterized protein LOC6584179 [Drosophila mojavensis]